MESDFISVLETDIKVHPRDMAEADLMIAIRVMESAHYLHYAQLANPGLTEEDSANIHRQIHGIHLFKGYLQKIIDGRKKDETEESES